MKKLFALLVLTLSLGCATGTVTEKTPVTKDLSAYHTASIAVNVSGKTEKPDMHKSQLALAIEKQLKEKSLFAEVVAEKGEIEIRVNLDKIDEGMSVAALGAEGNVDVGASIELFDTKENKGIGEFSATGTSKRSSTTTVAGHNVAGIQGKSAMAHEAMAEQIASYIASHRAGGAK
jgi:hypothetical protein